MRKRKFMAAVLSSVLIINSLSGIKWIEASENNNGTNTDAQIVEAIDWIVQKQNEDGYWSERYSKLDTYEAMTVLQRYEEDRNVNDAYDKAIEYANGSIETNTDYLSRQLMIGDLSNADEIHKLLLNQNKDGGFGITANYESDLQDTILALLAVDYFIKNTNDSYTEAEQAAVDAANYLMRSQNEDGSVGYEGTESGSVYLTSEYVNALSSFLQTCINKNIFADASIQNLSKEVISESLFDTKSYLEQCSISDTDEIQNKIALIEQYRALLKLKGLNETSDLENEVRNLQNENGSIDNDVYATALFINVIDEKNSIPTGEINDIEILKNGNEAESFDAFEKLEYKVNYTADENISLHIYVIDEKGRIVLENEEENGEFQIGTTKPGRYTIHAELKDETYGYIADESENAFSIRETISIDNVNTYLTENATLAGKDISVIEKVEFTSNANTDKEVIVKTVVRKDDENILENEVSETIRPDEHEHIVDALEFSPDTSVAGRYDINIRIIDGNNILAESQNVFTVNDKIPDTFLDFTQEKDKTCLYPTTDELGVKFRLKGMQNGISNSTVRNMAADEDTLSAETTENYDSGNFEYSSNLLKNNLIAFSMLNSHYSVGTLEGDPATINDNNKNLVYGHPGGHTSYTTLNIDNSVTTYSCGSTTVDLESGSLTTSQNYNNIINIEQIGTIITNPISGRKDIVQMKYRVQNTDTVSHNVGIRIMIDTMLGGNDHAPFRVPGYGGVTNELELSGDDIPQYYQVFDNLSNPSVVAQGIFYMNDELRPDKVQFVNWGKASSNAWNCVIANGAIGDSAVNTYWNPTELLPGEEREYVTYYGCGEISSNVEGNLVTGVTGVSRLEKTDNGYNPNPFTVTAYAYNIGLETMENVDARIILPEGLSLAEGEMDTKSMGELKPGKDSQTSWDVVAEYSEYDKTVVYSVEYSVNGNVIKTVNRTIFIPEYIDNIAARDVVLKTDINSGRFEIDSEGCNVAPSEIIENTNGTKTVTWNFDTILIDEIKEINVALKGDNLKAGETVPVCRNTILEYTDRDGNRQQERLDNISIPVCTYSLQTELSTDKDVYTANEDVKVTLDTQNLRVFGVTLTGHTALYNENNELVYNISDNENESWDSGEARELGFEFNTKRYSAGRYIIKSAWKDGENIISEAEKEITIVKDGGLSDSLVLDKSEYNQKEKVTINTEVKNTSSNFTEAGAKLVTRIINSRQEVVYEKEYDIKTLLGGESDKVQEYFDNKSLVPGVYEVLSEVISNDEIVATASKEFTVLSSEYTLAGVTGTLDLSSHEISPADTLTITSDIKNGSNEALENIVSYVTITSITDKKEIKRYEFHSTLDIGEDDNNISEFIGESLGEDDYIVTYEAVLGDGTVKTLATDYFTIKYIRDDFEEDSDLWNYMGDAYRSSEGYAVLTHNVNHQIGAMWLKKGIDKPFVTSFRYMEGGGNSADGFVFMFAKKPNEIGNEGRELGFAEGNGYGVEFDSFYNLFHAEHSGINSKHIALTKDSLSGNTPGEVLTPIAINLEKKFADKLGDNKWHDVEIYVDYTGIMVYVDGERAIEYKGEIDFDYDGFGFCAATGTNNDNHYIDDVVIRENTTLKKEVSDSYTLLGSAHESEEGYIVLTENEAWQSGAMWIDDVVSAPYDASFRYKSGGGSSADGFVFMFNKKGDEIGADGAYMGFAEGSGYGLEFDSFGNTNQGEHAAGGAKHIALSKDYIVTSNVGSTVPSLAITTDENVTSKINDGQWHDVVVKVRKDGVRVYLDTELILTYNGTLDDTYTSVGFAAATGSYSQYHYIDDVTINEDIEKITYTVEDDFSVDSGLWNYMGSAGYNQNQYGLLNQTAEWQAGAMWLKQEIGTEFETSFDYRIHRGNGYADGFTYMFFKKGNELGNTGQSMGFAENSGYAIEFDTYYNSEQDEKNNTYSMHIALVKNSTSGNSSQVLACTNDENIISKLCDESEHTVKVRVTLSTVTVYIDDEKALEYIGELDTTYRNTGFSAGTGGYNESHVIDNFTCTFDMYE